MVHAISMTTRLDYGILTLGLGILFFLAGTYIADNYAIGAAMALAGLLVLVALRRAIPTKTGVPPYAVWVRHLLLEGREEANRYLYTLLAPQRMVDREMYYATDNTLVVNALGYGKMGEEAAAKLYRRLHSDKPARLVVAVGDIDRNAAAILGLVADQLVVWKPNTLYRRLKKANALPALSVRRLRPRQWWRYLRPRHAWVFVLNAVWLVLMSLWLPYKTYYYIFAALNALLAVGIVLYNRFVA